MKRDEAATKEARERQARGTARLNEIFAYEGPHHDANIQNGWSRRQRRKSLGLKR